MGGTVPPLPNTPSWRGAQLGGAQGQLYLLPLLCINESLLYCIDIFLHLRFLLPISYGRGH